MRQRFIRLRVSSAVEVPNGLGSNIRWQNIIEKQGLTFIPDLEQVEKEILSQALQKHSWNQTRAAQYLNISRKTLIYRMEKFGLISTAIEEPDAPSPAEHR